VLLWLRLALKRRFLRKHSEIEMAEKKEGENMVQELFPYPNAFKRHYPVLFLTLVVVFITALVLRYSTWDPLLVVLVVLAVVPWTLIITFFVVRWVFLHSNRSGEVLWLRRAMFAMFHPDLLSPADFPKPSRSDVKQALGYRPILHPLSLVLGCVVNYEAWEHAVVRMERGEHVHAIRAWLLNLRANANNHSEDENDFVATLMEVYTRLIFLGDDALGILQEVLQKLKVAEDEGAWRGVAVRIILSQGLREGHASRLIAELSERGVVYNSLLRHLYPPAGAGGCSE
jgi:hypothetical protein